MDNTEIFENNLLIATINKGQFHEGLLKPALISSNNPIMVATFMPTAGDGATGLSPSGDPSMIIIPPIEQFKTDFNVTCAQFTTLDFGVSQKYIEEQYITIIAPDFALSDIFFDSTQLQPAFFSPIDNTGYSFANIETSDGTHSIYALFPIAVIVYGYGQAISYGYLGGMTFSDLQERFSLIVDNCEQKGSITYTEPFNSGINTYEIYDMYNCSYQELHLSK